MLKGLAHRVLGVRSPTYNKLFRKNQPLRAKCADLISVHKLRSRWRVGAGLVDRMDRNFITADHGIVKGGQYVVLPGLDTHNTLFPKEIYDPFVEYYQMRDSDEPYEFYDAENAWRRKEIETCDIGHVAKLEFPLPEISSKEKVRYYAEVIKILLYFKKMDYKYGLVHPEERPLFQHRHNIYQIVGSTKSIGIIDTKFLSGYLHTPLGGIPFECLALSEEELRKKIHERLQIRDGWIHRGLDGEVYEPSQIIEFDPYGLFHGTFPEWNMLRDHVYRQVKIDTDLNPIQLD